MSFPLLKNVEKPKTLRLNATRAPKYPFAQMEVGDAFLIPNKTKNTMTTYANDQGRALGRKFSTKLCWMRDDEDDGWVLCEEGHEDAVIGIGVWRDA